MASGPVPSGDEIRDRVASVEGLRHQNMVVGWILLDRTTLESDGTIKYHFLRPEQAKNFRDRDTVNRQAYSEASVDLTNKNDELRRFLIEPFIKLVLLQQHQWLVHHLPAQ